MVMEHNDSLVYFGCRLAFLDGFNFLPSRNQRAKPIIIDPGLYLSKKVDLALATEHRELPSTFKLFTGMCL
ncbi:hypothetical protein ZOSMA_12G00340 [Zostera marina]|uniref:Uncharacterized protein n=1 Tax=Zostera marina TaxID=29655 RepID=A0A0K9Q1L4_ZOSMR|nr:hypothetical protein ZOSMA_12G00340 [Zostera marina]